MKAQWDEGSGRILLGDNSRQGRWCCSRSVFIMSELWIQLGFLLCAYVADYIYSIPTGTGTYLLPKSGSVCYFWHAVICGTESKDFHSPYLLLKVVRRAHRWGVYQFSLNLGETSKFWASEGSVIWSKIHNYEYRTKSSIPGDLASEICAPLP